MPRTEIKISGFGGQGVITLGKLITAAVIKHTKGKTAAQSESYGAMARGGSCWTDIIIDVANFIDYPMTIRGNVDIAIFLSDLAVTRYKDVVKKKDGIIIYDPMIISKVKGKKTQKLYSIPAQKIATEDIKEPVTANVVMFGAFIGLTDIISKEAALKTVKEFVPSKAIDLNTKAFQKGYELGQSLKMEGV
ncbi:MAG: 2-oxoacid:acceptor oxidoreductase family protein [Candidatus Hodarchaeota archaeon]